MSAAAELKPFLFDEDGDRDIDLQFDPQQFRPVTPYTDDLDDEYQAAQDKLRELRSRKSRSSAGRRARGADEEGAAFQDRSRRGLRGTQPLSQHPRARGRRGDRLAEQCQAAHERLESHLANINALRPELWSRADRKAELARALGTIESAEDEIDAVAPMVQAFGKKSGGLFGGKVASLPRPAVNPSAASVATSPTGSRADSPSPSPSSALP